jgi:hypothetical protein
MGSGDFESPSVTHTYQALPFARADDLSAALRPCNRHLSELARDPEGTARATDRRQRHDGTSDQGA